jgi:twitching motility protein PilT
VIDTAQLRDVMDRSGAAGYSDLHLVPGGVLRSIGKHTELIPELEIPVADLLSTIGITDLEARTQARASLDLPDSQYRGRIAARIGEGGPSATIRLISRTIPTPEQLGLPNKMRELVRLPRGLVMFSGETNSGKSTTTAACLNELRDLLIYTVEDPIEYRYESTGRLVIQREVGTHVESFAAGIEDAKRSNPRVFVLGEILDIETARAALDMALSGHLVITTTHAGNAAETISGFIARFPRTEQPLVRVQLTQALQAIVTQQLLPGTDGRRVLAQEIALNTPEFSLLIAGDGESSDVHLVTQHLLGDGAHDGSVGMEASLAQLVATGRITRDQARGALKDPSHFDDLYSYAA